MNCHQKYIICQAWRLKKSIAVLKKVPKEYVLIINMLLSTASGTAQVGTTNLHVDSERLRKPEPSTMEHAVRPSPVIERAHSTVIPKSKPVKV